MNACTLIIVLIVFQIPLAAADTNCTDAGIVVVASVFATLAVVFIVLAIVGFLIWRRRRDILKPERLASDVTDHDGKDIGKFGYSNLALDVESGDGIRDTDSSRQYKPGKTVYGQERDLAKKTWSSLPPSDLPDVRQRKSSLGSLDKFVLDNNREEVWLTSQDFIGLGFNIAGSMRDGIFVSQVHNRGPAKESGKFKVGERIMNVGISFENMVYEDALTILSYASPYPVKVTLQKQQTIPKNRKLSDVRTNLNHPLYRSYSVDDLDIHTHERSFYPKRAASEMRYGQKELMANKNGQESTILEELGLASFDNEVFETPQTSVVVHRVVSDGNEKIPSDRYLQPYTESPMPPVKEDLNSFNNEIKCPDNGTSQLECIDPFETLTEQDKIDMLRLSYADPDVVAVVSYDKQQENSEVTSADLKSVPVKPERKKMRSSSNSTPLQSESELQDKTSIPVSSAAFDDEVFRSFMSPPKEAPPPIPEQDSEADEKLISPETKLRNITIDSSSIVFHQTAETSDRIDQDMTEQNDDFSNADMYLSDNQNAALSEKERDVSDENQVAVETFSATQVQKEANMPFMANIFIRNGTTDVCETDSSLTSPIPSQDNDTSKTQSDKLTDIQNSLHMNDSFDKSLKKFDEQSLSNDSGSFMELFTNKSTKTKENSLAYDISVTELEAMEQSVVDEERKKNEVRNKKGGIAFELRDDYVTGELRTVNPLNIHRTASYDTSLTTNRLAAKYICSQRPTSFKGAGKTHPEIDNGLLDWSGKRLVRSGSFSEIPQDDTAKDWIEEKRLIEDDESIEKHIQEDSRSKKIKKLAKATFVTSGRTLVKDVEDLSDSDSQCQSISSSSSGDSNTHPVNNSFDVSGKKDGNDDFRHIFSDTLEDKQRSNPNSVSISDFSETQENNEV